MTSFMFPAVPCDVCGPQTPPRLHTICHPVPGLRASGCGHPFAAHSAGLRCRICGRDCAGWQPVEVLDDEHLADDTEPDPEQMRLC